MSNTSKYKRKSFYDSYPESFWKEMNDKIIRENKRWLPRRENKSMKILKGTIGLIVHGGIGIVPFFLVYIMTGLALISVFQYAINKWFWVGVGVTIFGFACMLLALFKDKR